MPPPFRRSRWRSPPGRPLTASPTATPSRRSAISPAPTRSPSRCSPSTAPRRRRRSPAPPPARAASGARVFCRILTDGTGAEWPLSRKFGCVAEEAVDVLAHADALGLTAYGVSFHVGSQQTDTGAWDRALADASAVFRAAADH